MNQAQPNRLTTTSNEYAPAGPGTLAGDYLRRFWHPVYHSADLKPGRPVPLKIMNEAFTLYRGESGAVVLTDARCPHRGTLLVSGWVEKDDLRCVYHGWKFAADGECLEQPAEESRFCDRIHLKRRPTREYLGLIFAYFGAGEPPPFPEYPQFEHFDGLLEVDSYLRYCNYFQNVENSLDMSHVAFTHGNNAASFATIGLGRNLSVKETQWGIAYTFRRDDGQERIQHFGMPNIFYMTALPTDAEIGWQESLFWWVPIDDECHMQFSLHRIPVSGDAKKTIHDRRLKRREAITVPHQEACQKVITGERRIEDFDAATVDLVRLQDDIAQIGQGIFADRTKEALGKADVGVVTIRRLWRRELERLASKEELKDWSYSNDVRPSAWNLDQSMRRDEERSRSEALLAQIIDIRPQVEIEYQLKALHGAKRNPETRL